MDSEAHAIEALDRLLDAPTTAAGVAALLRYALKRRVASN
jgi:hypothetical protein